MIHDRYFYRDFTDMVQIQLGKIKVFQSEGVRWRFAALSHAPFLNSHVLVHMQNRVAERNHHHILETARTLLILGSVPRIYWAEAALISIYLIDCSHIGLSGRPSYK